MLKKAKGFFGLNIPMVKDTGILIDPLDTMGQEDDGILAMWMATEGNKKRTKI